MTTGNKFYDYLNTLNPKASTEYNAVNAPNLIATSAVKNAPKDIVGLINGFLNLAKSGAQDIQQKGIGAVADIPKTAGNMITGWAQNLNKDVGTPVGTDQSGNLKLQMPSLTQATQNFVERPVGTALDVAPFVKVKGLSELKGASKVSEVPKTLTENIGTKIEESPISTPKVKINIPDEEVNTFKNQYTVPTKRARAGDLDLTGTSKQILDHIKSGMKINPEEAPSLVTGQNGLSTKLTNQIVDNINSPINVSDITSAAKEILDKNKTAVGAARRKAIISDINSGINPQSFSNYINGKGINESGATGMSAADSLALSRQLDSLSSQYSRQSTYLTPNVESEIIAKAFSAAADRVMSKINESAVKDGAITKLDQPSIISEANNISPLYAQQITEALLDPTSPLSKVRSTAAPFVRFQKIIDMTKDAKNSVGGKMVEKTNGINVGGIPVTAEEFGQHLAGFPGKIIGKVVDKKMAKDVINQPHDFSQPWVDQSSATLQKSSLPKVPSNIGNNLLKVGGALFQNTGNNNPNTTQQDGQTNPISVNNNASNNPQDNHNVIIPQTIDEIKPASNGSWSSAVPDQYHILGSNGQPVTMSADSYKTERASLNDAYNASKAKSDVINTPQNIADTASKKSALDNLDTNYSLGQKLDEPYKNAIKSTQSIDEAKRILSTAPANILNSFKNIDQLASSTNADYSKLGKILQAISTNYPEAGVIFQPGQTKDVLAQSIDQAAKLVLNDYYGNFRAFTGNPTQANQAESQPIQQSGLPSQITPTPTPQVNNSRQGGWMTANGQPYVPQGLPPNPFANPQ